MSVNWDADLIELLRNNYWCTGDVEGPTLVKKMCEDAADEIERLNGVIDEMAVEWAEQEVKLNNARAEVVRLKAAITLDHGPLLPMGDTSLSATEADK